MAVDMFLTGRWENSDLGGESKDKQFKGAVDVLSWSWGMSQSGTMEMGGAAGAGKASIQDLSFTKYVDTSTPDFIFHCTNGTHLRDLTLSVRKAGNNPVVYIKIEMFDVIVTNVSCGGSGGEDRLTENISLNFARFKYHYNQQDESGQVIRKPSVEWNIAENQGTLNPS